VSKIKEVCQADAERISGEKADAEEDLAKAQVKTAAFAPIIIALQRCDSTTHTEMSPSNQSSSLLCLVFTSSSPLPCLPFVITPSFSYNILLLIAVFGRGRACCSIDQAERPQRVEEARQAFGYHQADFRLRESAQDGPHDSHR
jgi:hypothetical protein